MPSPSLGSNCQTSYELPGKTRDSPVCTIYTRGKLSLLASSTVLSKMRGAAAALGREKLGCDPEDIGAHSIRSGAAMAMYLDNVPVFSIMLIGRWSSDAFLRHIRKQVQQFSCNVSARMIKHQHFFTIPDFSPEDPRMRNCRDLYSTRSDIGPGQSQWMAQLPSFSLVT